jgi:hypothetical protein
MDHFPLAAHLIENLVLPPLVSQSSDEKLGGMGAFATLASSATLIFTAFVEHASPSIVNITCNVNVIWLVWKDETTCPS